MSSLTEGKTSARASIGTPGAPGTQKAAAFKAAKKGLPSVLRTNEELELRNQALERGLREISSNREELERRQKELEQHLEAAAFSLATSENVRNETEHILKAQVRSADSLIAEKYRQEEDIAELKMAIAEAHQEVVDQDQRTQVLEREVESHRQAARDAQRLVESLRAVREQETQHAGRKARRTATKLARAQWRCLGAELSLRQSRRNMMPDEVKLAVQRAVVSLSERELRASNAARRDVSPDLDDESARDSTWSLEQWLVAVPFASMVAKAIRRRLGAQTAAHQRAYLARLGAMVPDRLSDGAADVTEILTALLGEASVRRR